jgi:hypothetical protein
VVASPNRLRRSVAIALLCLAAGIGLATSQLLSTGSEPGVRVIWRSDFSRDNFTAWSWWGQGQANLWGHIAVVRPASVGVPDLFGDRYIGRFQTTQADIARGRYSAKLYKWFEVNGPHGPRPPANVSGTYSAWYYLPRGFSMQPGKWINMFQFKEMYRKPDGASVSDPLWWIQLGTTTWAKTDPRALWRTGKPTRGNAPVLFLNHWYNKWTHRAVFAAVPLGRWFEITADVHQGDRIDFSLNRHPFETVSAGEYPVSPFHARSEAWIFGVGDYGTDAAGPLYVGQASVSMRLG